MDEFYKRISDFLLEYVSVTKISGEAFVVGDILSERDIKRSIKTLLDNKAFSKEEIKKILLKYHNVIVSNDFLEKCANFDDKVYTAQEGKYEVK